MDDELKIKMSAFTLDCKDPNELAKFYAALLKWEIPFYDEEYAVVGACLLYTSPSPRDA